MTLSLTDRVHFNHPCCFLKVNKGHYLSMMSCNGKIAQIYRNAHLLYPLYYQIHSEIASSMH